ncbi:hypothetical protein SAMN05421639_102673 [Chryseobacterium shigense]|uniref:Uncharacterized protein n=1 Tax=Chryseobacterium shigense TaxID=297244 RepID=A0A1N7I916_9FLAO|nr:hypothetical protein [Chryseobacterium shigense]SIS33578.1 hypothetical protein SAMN05421639_102673 [Chryseobacterium shigense]
MFKDDQSIKGPSSKGSVKNIMASQQLKSAAVQKIDEKLQKADEAVKKSAKKAQEVYSGATQNSKMFMNQTLVPNNPSITETKVWAKQPTSKIHNAAAIPESLIAGINRVVMLDIVIEGQIIKHFKHFKLAQSASKHHEFSLTLAHDTSGRAGKP